MRRAIFRLSQRTIGPVAVTAVLASGCTLFAQYAPYGQPQPYWNQAPPGYNQSAPAYSAAPPPVYSQAPYSAPQRPYSEESSPPYDQGQGSYTSSYPVQPTNAPQPSAEQQASLSAAELDNLVAPVALYPDPLLSQLLVASTYPLEVVEAQQWLQANRNLAPRQLVDAAKQQSWDPSVQALVAFPDVLAFLNTDIRWTTDLGNAFLAQAPDVMNAIQDLRGRASANGQLRSTPQLAVNAQAVNGQSAIQIQPVDPQMMYVPAYDPASVWGPPSQAPPSQAYYPFPAYQGGYAPAAPAYEGAYAPAPEYQGAYAPSPYAASYPQTPYEGSGIGFGSLFQSAISLASLFTGFPGIVGGSGWGWGLNWVSHALFTNNGFFNLFGFLNFFDGGGGGYNGGGYNNGGYVASAVWVHNPAHRLGVPYARGFVPRAYGSAYSTQRVSTHGASSFAQNTRTVPYSQPYRQSQPQQVWNNSRPLQQTSRGPGNGYSGYPGVSNSYRAPSNIASRPVTPNGYANSYAGQSSPFSHASAPPNRSFQSWGSQSQPYRGAPARIEAPRNSAPQHFASTQNPKPQHFSAPKAPHYSAPHSSSHSSGHSSHEHSSGKKSHHG